jgi:hypothetical protein
MWGGIRANLKKLYMGSIAEHKELVEFVKLVIQEETGVDSYSPEGSISGWRKPKSKTGRWRKKSGGLTDEVNVEINPFFALMIRLWCFISSIFKGCVTVTIPTVFIAIDIWLTSIVFLEPLKTLLAK